MKLPRWALGTLAVLLVLLLVVLSGVVWLMDTDPAGWFRWTDSSYLCLGSEDRAVVFVLMDGDDIPPLIIFGTWKIADDEVVLTLEGPGDAVDVISFVRRTGGELVPEEAEDRDEWAVPVAWRSLPGWARDADAEFSVPDLGDESGHDPWWTWVR